jgi:hypothetical protein
MSGGSIRRAQLVSPFGVGAMSVLVDGTSVITAGLDFWFPDSGGHPNFEISEFVEYDWRLQGRLSVSSFRLPPDHRQGSGNDKNLGLKVPALRFPTWNVCPLCRRMSRSPLTMRQVPKCSDSSHPNKRLTQVAFVAICVDGHIDDFPFREWVHRSLHPSCEGQLRLKSSGGGGLEGQVVSCERCNRSRSLRGTTSSTRGVDGEERTTLTNTLTSEEDLFYCTGARPWLGSERGPCAQPTKGALRGSGNVYFPKVQSSIYVPIEEGAISPAMHQLMSQPAVDVLFEGMYAAFDAGLTPEVLRKGLNRVVPEELFLPIGDEELIAAYRDRFGIGGSELAVEELGGGDTDLLTADETWRFPEYRAIRETPSDARLAATDPGLDRRLAPLLGRVRSVDVLRETRALYGFTRVSDDVLRVPVGKALLRRSKLSPAQDWLPAYVVKGEGIYLEFADAALDEWENRPGVVARAQAIQKRYGLAVQERGFPPRELSPRFLLLHTFAHVLINELIFKSGYSSASLRERLYVSSKPGSEMASVLIYTAAGDSEGTMGGLVRMSRPNNLVPVIESAIADARWCSADPVCMDAGEKGQGLNSCNGAACHACSLLPETSCEEQNQFLDRGLLIGTLDSPDLGYFSRL